MVTGASGAGKTSLLVAAAAMAAADGRRLGGIVAPAVFRRGEKIGIRARDLATGSEWPLASATEAWDGPAIGPYRFSRVGVDRAVACLLESSADRPDALVIDEVGPLELLRRDCLYPACTHLRNSWQGRLIAVVRPSLVREAVDFFLGSASPGFACIEAGRPEAADRLATWISRTELDSH